MTIESAFNFFHKNGFVIQQHNIVNGRPVIFISLDNRPNTVIMYCCFFENGSIDMGEVQWDGLLYPRKHFEDIFQLEKNYNQRAEEIKDLVATRACNLKQIIAGYELTQTKEGPANHLGEILKRLGAEIYFCGKCRKDNANMVLFGNDSEPNTPVIFAVNGPTDTWIDIGPTQKKGDKYQLGAQYGYQSLKKLSNDTIETFKEVMSSGILTVAILKENYQ